MTSGLDDMHSKAPSSIFCQRQSAQLDFARAKAVFTPQVWNQNGSGTVPVARVQTCSTASTRSGTSRPPRDVIAVERFRNRSGWLCFVNGQLDPFRNESSQRGRFVYTSACVRVHVHNMC